MEEQRHREAERKRKEHEKDSKLLDKISRRMLVTSVMS